MGIRENIDDIMKRVENTCKKIGRAPKDITV
ncbi:MAG TPA: YggS family pyridoxal phosphate enzyme, partial [Clostridiales bacterium]|nr:YggS family pyridoxal phosphate enzyme [Clostridiales bacterium]